MDCEPDDQFFQFSFLTYNIWGLPGFLSTEKSVRIRAISQELAKTEYDVICLQEVWCTSDYESFKECLKPILPYCHYFYSGVTGSGLCVFSKWPIENIVFHRWPLNGYAHMVHHGDWYGGKGIGLIQINVNGVRINVYNTHLHAQYDTDSDNYLAHRVVQAFDSAMFIAVTSPYAHISILGGDLNSSPKDLCYDLFLFEGKMKDAYIFKEGVNSGTNGNSKNSFSDAKYNYFPEGLRIDHVLYRANKDISVTVSKYDLPFPDRIPGKDFSFSDHEAVAVRFRIQTAPEVKEQEINESHKEAKSFEDCLTQGLEVCSKELDSLELRTRYYWFLFLFACSLLFIIPTATEFPAVHSFKYLILIVLIIILMCFLIIMATIWFKWERNSILNAKEQMAVSLKRLKRVGFNSYHC